MVKSDFEHGSTQKPMISALSRRAVLKAASAIGAVGLVGVTASPSNAKDASHGVLNAFLSVTENSRFVFMCPATEIGQGVTTSLTQILAHGLGVPWDIIDVNIAGAGDVFANPGKSRQSVGQSFSVRGYYPLLKAMGAAARLKLESAASDHLGVPPAWLIFGHQGIGLKAHENALPYYEAAVAAGPLSTTIPVEDPPRTGAHTIGKSLPRKDVPSKVDGTARFASDVSLPNMVYAAIAFAPIGGAFSEADVTALKAQPGVASALLMDAKPRSALVAISKRWWSADQALKATLNQGRSGTASTADLARKVKGALAQAPRIAVGAVEADEGPWTVEADYDVPYLAHATMEPMSAVADVQEGRCTVYAGAQSQTGARSAVARALGIEPDNVTIDTTYGGGGFGRRWYHDFSSLAARLSQHLSRPVKLLYSREADMDADYFRPAAAAKFKARLAKDGRIEALDLATSGQSVMEFGRPGRLKGRADPTSTSGLKDQPYKTETLRVAWHPVEADVPVGVWRSVGHSQNTFFLESFIDELARAAGQDPAQYRLAQFAGHPRLAAVLKAIMKGPDRDTAATIKRGCGVAVAEAYGSYIAQSVEIEIPEPKRIKIRRIHCAFDCGTAINPRGVKSQIEGGILYGLSAALWGQVEIEAGRVTSDNFHAYPVVSLAQSPDIDITLIEDADAPLGGAGEPGVPPLAPALVNAIADATGVRVRSLPLINQGWELV